MDIIAMTRDLGKAIQKDERYLNMIASVKRYEESVELNSKLEKFAELRSSIDAEIAKPEGEKNNQLMVEMDSKLREMYNEIMQIPEMVEYNKAKDEMQVLLSFVTQIISGSANGQNPDEIKENDGCSGSCSSCGGCH